MLSLTSLDKWNTDFAETITTSVVSGIKPFFVKPEVRKQKKGSDVTGKDFEAFKLRGLSFNATIWKGTDAVNLVRYVTTELESYTNKILQNKESLKTKKVSNLQNEKELVQPLSQELLENLVKVFFKNIHNVSAVQERSYGQIFNNVSIITGGRSDHAVVYKAIESDDGFCLGVWEDKAISHALDKPEIAQLCTAMIAEEYLYEEANRYPVEMCGILTNGLDFMALKRERKKANKFSNLYYRCDDKEQTVKALVHFLANCRENLDILLSAEFDISGNMFKRLAISEEGTGDDSSDVNEEEFDASDGGGKKTPPLSNHASTNQLSLRDTSFVEEYFARSALSLTRQNLKSLAH